MFSTVTQSFKTIRVALMVDHLAEVLSIVLIKLVTRLYCVMAEAKSHASLRCSTLVYSFPAMNR